MLIDVTRTLGLDSVCWPGDAVFRTSPALSIAAGDPANLTKLEMTNHVGTHLDAPLHCIDGGAALDEWPIERFRLPAWVLEARPRSKLIGPEALERRRIDPGQAVLFKTANGELPRDRFYEEYTALALQTAKRLAELREEFGKISTTDWNRNLYWSWLYALKGLIKPVEGPGWPTFMTTTAWQDKQLNAALGSWAALRHDTILYAKQSYTPTIHITSAEPPRPQPKPVVGYVEPAPEFYARLVALTRMSAKGLDSMKVLDETSRARLNTLEQILVRLQKLSEMELKNQELTESDYEFIRNFGEQLSAVVAGAQATAQKTTLVADVHTDQNTGKVLEEATGYIRLLLVAYKMPQGHILIGAGPAFSYYEFKHPMSDRLTDEKWRDMLRGGSAPSLPEWVNSYSVY